MKPFDELKEYAKSSENPALLSGIERNAVDGLRGILLQCKYRDISAEDAKEAVARIGRDYENALTEQEIHRRACEMRVEMAKVNREAELNGCPLCKRMLTIMDGLKRE